MARKHFSDLIAGAPLKLDEGEDLAPRISIRSAKSLGDGLSEIQANAVRELDPRQIFSSVAKDRLKIDDESIDALAESIKKNGQHVPILVRPVPGNPDRFEIIYGRRRLEAIRRLGPGHFVKAIVRKMEDEQAVIAQGQENNQRLDLSFIEKALFARELNDLGYQSNVILDALCVDKATLSRFRSVADAIPTDLVVAIGPAHDIGRRKWLELADIAKSHPDLLQNEAFAALRAAEDGLSSSERFELVFKAVLDAFDISNLSASKRVEKVADAVSPEVVAPILVPEQGEGAPSPIRNELAEAPGAEADAEVEDDEEDETRPSPPSEAVPQPKKPTAAPGFDLSLTSQRLQLTVKRRENPAFYLWLEDNIDRITKDIQQRWIDESMS